MSQFGGDSLVTTFTADDSGLIEAAARSQQILREVAAIAQQASDSVSSSFDVDPGRGLDVLTRQQEQFARASEHAAEAARRARAEAFGGGAVSPAAPGAPDTGGGQAPPGAAPGRGARVVAVEPSLGLAEFLRQEEELAEVTERAQQRLERFKAEGLTGVDRLAAQEAVALRQLRAEMEQLAATSPQNRQIAGETMAAAEANSAQRIAQARAEEESRADAQRVAEEQATAGQLADVQAELLSKRLEAEGRALDAELVRIERHYARRIAAARSAAEREALVNQEVLDKRAARDRDAQRPEDGGGGRLTGGGLRNMLLGGVGVMAGLEAVHLLFMASEGSAQKLAEHVKQLPFGLGQAARTLEGILGSVTGWARETERVKRETELLNGVLRSQLSLSRDARRLRQEAETGAADLARRGALAGTGDPAAAILGARLEAQRKIAEAEREAKRIFDEGTRLPERDQAERDSVAAEITRLNAETAARRRRLENADPETAPLIQSKIDTAQETVARLQAQLGTIDSQQAQRRSAAAAAGKDQLDTQRAVITAEANRVIEQQLRDHQAKVFQIGQETAQLLADAAHDGDDEQIRQKQAHYARELSLLKKQRDKMIAAREEARTRGDQPAVEENQRGLDQNREQGEAVRKQRDADMNRTRREQEEGNARELLTLQAETRQQQLRQAKQFDLAEVEALREANRQKREEIEKSDRSPERKKAALAEFDRGAALAEANLLENQSLDAAARLAAIEAETRATILQVQQRGLDAQLVQIREHNRQRFEEATRAGRSERELAAILAQGLADEHAAKISFARGTSEEAFALAARLRSEAASAGGQNREAERIGIREDTRAEAESARAAGRGELVEAIEALGKLREARVSQEQGQFIGLQDQWRRIAQAAIGGGIDTQQLAAAKRAADKAEVIATESKKSAGHLDTTSKNIDLFTKAFLEWLNRPPLPGSYGQ